VHAKTLSKRDPWIDRSKEGKDGENHSFIIAYFLVVVFAREAKQSGGKKSMHAIVNKLVFVECDRGEVCHGNGNVDADGSCSVHAGRVLSPLGRVRFQGLGWVSFLDCRVQALAASKGMRLKGIIPFPFSFKKLHAFSSSSCVRKFSMRCWHCL
jgi:hypothetical protein